MHCEHLFLVAKSDPELDKVATEVRFNCEGDARVKLHESQCILLQRVSHIVRLSLRQSMRKLLLSSTIPQRLSPSFVDAFHGSHVVARVRVRW
jgi:hypothetical protein